MCYYIEAIYIVACGASEVKIKINMKFIKYYYIRPSSFVCYIKILNGFHFYLLLNDQSTKG